MKKSNGVVIDDPEKLVRAALAPNGTGPTAGLIVSRRMFAIGEGFTRTRGHGHQRSSRNEKGKEWGSFGRPPRPEAVDRSVQVVDSMVPEVGIEPTRTVKSTGF